MARGLTVLCWAVATPGLLWAAVRLLGVERGPLVQLLAFTPYVAAWSLAPVALALGLRRWWPAGVAAATAVALLGVVAPRAIGGSADAEGPTLRVLTANLLRGTGDAETLVRLVREHDVDVLAVQEFTPEAAARLDAHGLAALLPHRRLHPVVGTEGSGLYSRFPLSDVGVRENPGGFSQVYGTLTAPGAAPTTVESVHPAGPYDGDRIPPVTIDHVLVDRRVGVRDVSVLRLPGSDHRPVYAELALPRGDLGG
jgi:endonuclease/exonuclease/phosphatase (EEP) superfamily protein YafD